eukprot:CAMPEP_0178926472 /NCGR_PEP_ID=MMETSP0786-20121207/18552_1 /TAXON_ID=186022 /ORGANISM="Thalassionema frauenfeldii, Strain CCMP 1798" /LENGTH=62 /DNA_ID=CAMNT_0020601599 /DNA_START=150 /DNA_END=335 /DNA_ORIENTATION=-
MKTKAKMDPELWSIIEHRAMKLREFSSIDYSNIAWAFAKVGRKSPALFNHLEYEASFELDEF